jgi:hypothetical protein
MTRASSIVRSAWLLQVELADGIPCLDLCNGDVAEFFLGHQFADRIAGPYDKYFADVCFGEIDPMFCLECIALTERMLSILLLVHVWSFPYQLIRRVECTGKNTLSNFLRE